MAPRHPWKINEAGYDASTDWQDALDRQHDLEREQARFDYYITAKATALVNEIGPMSMSKTQAHALAYEMLERVAKEAARVPHAVRR